MRSLKKLANFTGKHLCWSLFVIKLQFFSLQFFKKRLQHKCFPVKFEKLLRTPILKNICKRLLLGVFYKKAVLKKLWNIHGTKVASDGKNETQDPERTLRGPSCQGPWSLFFGMPLVIKCSVRKCSWWLIELWKWRIFKVCNGLNELLFPMSSVLAKLWN